MTYYSLLERDGPLSPWRIEFGDFERETVADEREDRRDHDVKASNLKIIATGSSASAIAAKVAALNGDANAA